MQCTEYMMLVWLMSDVLVRVQCSHLRGVFRHKERFARVPTGNDSVLEGIANQTPLRTRKLLTLRDSPNIPGTENRYKRLEVEKG